MAYISEMSDEEKKKQEAQGAGVRTSGVVDGAVTASGNTGDIAKPTTKPGTGFVNLQQYLDTNKGVGGKLAGDITKGVSDSAEAFKTNASSAVDKAKPSFAGASNDAAADTINKNLKTDATATYDTAKNFLGSGYEGPKATDYTTGLAVDRNAIQGNLSQVDNQANIQANLQDTYGKGGGYTKGFELLDSFLIGGDKSGQDKLAEVKGLGAGVDAAYDTSSTQLSQAEQAARDKLQSNKQAIVDNAKTEKENLLAIGADKVADLNKTLDSNKVGTQTASLGNVFGDKEYSDLDALANLSLTDKNWNKVGTFNAGKDKPKVLEPQKDAPNSPTALDINPVVMPPPINGTYVADGKPGENKDFGPVTEAGRTITNNVDKLDKLSPWIDTMDTIGSAPGAVWDSTRELIDKPSMDRLKDVGTEVWKPVGAALEVGKNAVDETGRLIDKTVGETLRNTGDVTSKAYEDTKDQLKRISIQEAQDAARKAGEDAKAEAGRVAEATKAAAAKAEADTRAAAEQAAKDLSIKNAQEAANKAADDVAAEAGRARDKALSAAKKLKIPKLGGKSDTSRGTAGGGSGGNSRTIKNSGSGKSGYSK